MLHALCISVPWFSYTHNIPQGTQILKLLIIQFFQATCCFFLRSTHFLMILYSNNLSLIPFLTMTDQLSYPYRTKNKMIFVYCNFYVFLSNWCENNNKLVASICSSTTDFWSVLYTGTPDKGSHTCTWKWCSRHIWHIYSAPAVWNFSWHGFPWPARMVREKHRWQLSYDTLFKFIISCNCRIYFSSTKDTTDILTLFMLYFLLLPNNVSGLLVHMWRWPIHEAIH